MVSILTPEFIAKCKEDFKVIDANGDGFLDEKEFRAGSNCSATQKDGICSLLKENKHSEDWKMDVDEFIAMMAASTKGDEFDKDLADFLFLDKDHNGLVSFEEYFQAVIRDCPDPEKNKGIIQEVFNRMDTNGDGNIDFEEYKNVSKLMEEPKDGEKVDELKAGFILIDKDGNGLVTVDEYYNFLKAVVPEEQINMDEVKLIFKEFDTNGDGFIDFEEFKVMMAKLNQAIGEQKK